MTPASGAVIVGASIAGLSTAEALRACGYDAPITVFGEEPELPYSRPPLSKRLPLEIDLVEPLTDVAQLQQRGIRLITSRRVEHADLLAKRVFAGGEAYEYETLVAATGCAALPHPAVPQGLTLRTAQDAARIRQELHRAQSVAIIGGGVLACELASACRALDIETNLLVRGSALTLGGAGRFLSSRLEVLLREHGVHIAFNAVVSSSSPAPRSIGAARPHPRATSLVLEGGGRLEVDLVLVAIGAAPRTSWLDDNGLNLSDGVLCDSRGRFAQHAYAVGDMARWMRHDGDVMSARRCEHQTNALEQAAIVAAAITGSTEPTGLSNFFWSEMFGVRIQVRGETPADGRVVVLAQDPDTGRQTLGVSVDNVLRGLISWNMARSFRQSVPLLGRRVETVPVAPGTENPPVPTPRTMAR